MTDPAGTQIVDEKRRRETGDALREAFGPRIRSNTPLAPLTTFKMGGPADWFLQTPDPDDVVVGLSVCRQLGLPLTVIGGGSNILVGPRGVRGLVVRLWHGAIEATSAGRIRADAGVSLNGLVRWSILRSLAGLEEWAGMPGTVGGALYGNAHFRGKLIGQRVRRVGLVSPAGDVIVVDGDEMAFGYDVSRLQTSGELAQWAEFDAVQGRAADLRAHARRSLAYRKSTQPLSAPSAGCIFQNPDPQREPLPPDVPCSAGALIDRAGLKGRAVGTARVSTVHGNFIVAEPPTDAGDVRALIELCRAEVQARFGIRLRDEIRYLGEF